MTPAALPTDAAHDAALALALFVHDPLRFGGIVLRGDGPARDAMLDALTAAIGARGPVVRIPVNVDTERLLGGLDLTATLTRGTSVQRMGLLDSARGGAVIVPMAERLRGDIAAHIAQAIDRGTVAAVLLDDSRDDDAGLPPGLAERAAFHCDVAGVRGAFGAGWESDLSLSFEPPPLPGSLDDTQFTAIAATAAALGVASVRALNFAVSAAQGCAALDGRILIGDDDIAAAVRLVLAPRATQVPQSAPPPDQSDDAPPPQPDSDDGDSPDIPREALDDIVLEAAAAAIPPHILDQIERRSRSGGKAAGGRAGDRQASAQRGRPLGARPGIPGQGRKLALIATLRAAAPWQAMRRADARMDGATAAPAGIDTRIHIRKSDLRVRHHEERRTALTIFAVDASGSAALTRLAEAKGAVELMLAAAYVKRAEVALIAFRAGGADLLLPPTRSLTRARRALAALPGGGGTPLAAGVIAAGDLAARAQRSGQTPLIALLTDGKANVRQDGTADRAGAMAEAATAARTVAAAAINTVVIDISPRPTPEAAALAAALGGRYVPLPRAGSAALVAAIDSTAAR